MICSFFGLRYVSSSLFMEVYGVGSVDLICMFVVIRFELCSCIR